MIKHLLFVLFFLWMLFPLTVAYGMTVVIDSKASEKVKEEPPKKKKSYSKPVPSRTGVYPYKKDQVEMEIEAILARKKPSGFTDADKDAINLLNVYRFLCGVDYAVKLSSSFTQQAQKAATRCKDRNMLSHDIGEYTDLCNLAMNTLMKDKALQVRQYMEDRGERNREKRGHRSHCLRPALSGTGFGLNGMYAAMRVYGNQVGRPIATRKFYAYPGPGYFPQRYLHGNGWSFYAPSQKEFPGNPTVELWQLSEPLAKLPNPDLPFTAGTNVKINAQFKFENGVVFEPNLNPANAVGIYFIRIKAQKFVYQYLVDIYAE